MPTVTQRDNMDLARSLTETLLALGFLADALGLGTGIHGVWARGLPWVWVSCPDLLQSELSRLAAVRVDQVPFVDALASGKGKKWGATPGAPSDRLPLH